MLCTFSVLVTTGGGVGVGAGGVTTGTASTCLQIASKLCDGSIDNGVVKVPSANTVIGVIRAKAETTMNVFLMSKQ